MRSWNLYQVFFVLIALFLSSRTVTGAELDAEQLFDSTRLLEVEISLPEKDWDALCAQSRVRGGFASLFSNTAEKPFTYFKADVKVDGVKIPSVGIRKKGFIGSLDETRPSLKVKFGEYVDQKPVKGLDRLTLNNNKQDTALVSQFLSYKVFNDAGVHAPRVSFARVTVNGEYLGIHSNVESVKKPFLIARYGDSSGNHYEGTLADFYPKTIAKFETKTKTKPQDDPDLKRLSELLHSDENLPMDEIEKLVDLDSFLKFWAVESLLGFWDGYTQNQNNFFVYDNPANDKFYFMPWGADSCFSPGRRGFGSVGGGPQFESVRAEAMLPNRLFRSEGIPDRYKQALLDVLETAWDEKELLGEVDRIEKLTAGQLHANQKTNGGGSPWGGRSLTMDGVRRFIEGRRDEVMSELKDWPVEVPDKPASPCTRSTLVPSVVPCSRTGRKPPIQMTTARFPNSNSC